MRGKVVVSLPVKGLVMAIVEQDSSGQRLVAVALRYLATRDTAPRIIAKGRAELAQRILKVARSRGIPVYPDEDLAETLYRLDLEEEIPHQLYRAVAEVLAFIYVVNSRAQPNSQNK
jgi:flagellar biosynthesis protein